MKEDNLPLLRHRFVQLAAVAVAAVEKMDEDQRRCYDSTIGAMPCFFCGNGPTPAKLEQT